MGLFFGSLRGKENRTGALDKRRLRGSMADIMTLAEIKTEVLPTLALEEKAELAAMLSGNDETVAGINGDLWDAQIREDARAGRLDFLFDEADAEYARGETEEWP